MKSFSMYDRGSSESSVKGERLMLFTQKGRGETGQHKMH